MTSDNFHNFHMDGLNAGVKNKRLDQHLVVLVLNRGVVSVEGTKCTEKHMEQFCTAKSGLNKEVVLVQGWS